MKQLMIILFLITGSILLIPACNNTSDYKVARQQVLDSHDKLMGLGETAMSLKMCLDTLDLNKIKRFDPQTDTVAERNNILLISKGLNDADEKMSDWMHKFKADYKGSSAQDAFNYYLDQKAKVETLDSIYKDRIAIAGAYMKRFHIQHMSGSSHKEMKM
jgi:hypothetical protein